VLAQTWDAGLFDVLAWIATVVLVALWLMTAFSTLAGIRRGTIWAH
jgi:hypothetical protein